MIMVLRALFIFGLLEWIFAGVWLLVVAFRRGLGHGFLMLFAGGIYSIIFSILHWDEAKKPFLTGVLGGALMIGSAVLGPILLPPETWADESGVAAQESPATLKQKWTHLAAQVVRAAARPRPASSAPGAPPAAAAVPTNLAQSLLALMTQEPTPAAQPATTGEWAQARAQLRVNGVMQRDTQIVARVNEQVLKIDDVIEVELNGRPYRFKVRDINLRHTTVDFEPVD